jgi:hypothetical protein
MPQDPKHSGGTPADDMPGDGIESSVDTTISQGASQFVDDIVSKALEEIDSEEERELLREGLTETMTTTLWEIADAEISRLKQASAATNGHALANGNGSFAVGDVATTGMNVAKQVKDIGFVEFTTGLVTGVFDTLIASTLKQMEGYAKLVKEIGSSLAEFAAANVSGADVDAHLNKKYPDGTGGTVVTPAYTFKDTAEDTVNGIPAKSANEKLKEVAGALLLATSDLPESRRLTEEQVAIDSTQKSFTLAQARLIRTAISFVLATDMRGVLREMVREGMARIVVTNGVLKTKLTFNVTSNEVAAKQKASYHRDSASAYIRGHAGVWWGGVTAGADWSQVNVNTVNEQTFDQLTMSTEMIGAVDLNFRTETFPPRDIVPAD